MNSSARTAVSLGRVVLNPNAEEFVPFSVNARVPARDSNSPSVCNFKAETKPLTGENGGRAVLNRTDSTNSNASDDECRKYWRSQLPDDITPDFDSVCQLSDDRVVAEEFVSDVSLLDYSKVHNDASEFRIGRKQRSISQDLGFGNPIGRMKLDEIAWEQQAFFLGDQNKQFIASNGLDNSTGGFAGDHLSNNDIKEIDPIAFLINKFPGFAAQSLVDIYHANGGNLSLTVEMLAHVELQEEEGSVHLLPQPSCPNLNFMEFPSLSRPEIMNGLSQFEGDDAQQPVTVQRTVELETVFPTRAASAPMNPRATDFAAVLRKHASTLQWPYEKSVADFLLGSSRDSSQSLGLGLSGSFRRQISQSRHSQLPQAWLETWDTVENVYFEAHEEARDHARIRNAYFEQARHAYLVGNKALAKDPSAKSQWHNNPMKAAHSNTGETNFQNMNVSAAATVQSCSQGQPRLLDLHGLHVSEAICLLKHEIATLRMAARSTQQQQQIYICVGHNAKGSQAPARLPLAVEHYLSVEHVNFRQTQPGMLCAVLS